MGVCLTEFIRDGLDFFASSVLLTKFAVLEKDALCFSEPNVISSCFYARLYVLIALNKLSIKAESAGTSFNSRVTDVCVHSQKQTVLRTRCKDKFPYSMTLHRNVRSFGTNNQVQGWEKQVFLAQPI